MGSRAGKTFEPFPSFFLKDKEMRSKRGYLDNIQKARKDGGDAQDVKESNKDIKSIRKLLQKIPSVKQSMANCNDDQALMATLEKNTKEPSDVLPIYKLLQYLVCTNRVSFKLLKGEEKISESPLIDEYIIYNHEASKERTFQDLKSKKGSVWTFHGSNIENWYSILRNGPRNLSNTKMMTAGASMGAGVYSAKAFATAQGYAAPRYVAANNNNYYANGVGVLDSIASWKHCDIKSKCIVGVLEIIKDSSYSKHGDFDVLVCPDDHCIILRYIWVFAAGSVPTIQTMTDKANFKEKYYDQVNLIQENLQAERVERLQSAHERAQKRYEEEVVMKQKMEEQLKEKEIEDESKKYDDKIESLESKFIGKGSATATKRILKEYKHFQTSSDIENFEIKFKSGDNFYQWSVILDILKFELTPDLKKDFEWMQGEQGIDPTLEFELIFSSSFPFDPPFIRVVKPIFKFHTGHVTIGGSLCMESITPAGWSSARSIEGIFIEILSIILQGGARLDKTRLGHCYSVHEARSAFERVAKQHGWL